MKKLCLSLALLTSSVVCMAELEGNVGIGVGTEIFKGHNGLISQVSAATTNGCFGNQTFAITSGTLGAEKPGEIWAQRRQVSVFVAGNMDNVARDIAMGGGEHLKTIAKIMQVTDQQKFEGLMQDNFEKIYTSENITNTEVVANIFKVVNG